MKTRGAPTRADLAYDELRADILAGRRLPGSRLPSVELTRSYGASVGVVRETLSRLTAEGLVESEPQHGFRVVPLSVPDLEHLTDARVVVETMVLRQAIEHSTVSWESDVLAAHHRLDRCPQLHPGDQRLSDDWMIAHAAFHRTLLAACPNVRLVGVAEMLRDAAELYRQWSIPMAHSQRDIAGEHRAILDAVLARDPDLAVATLTSHIRTTTNLLLEQAKASAGPLGIEP